MHIPKQLYSAQKAKCSSSREHYKKVLPTTGRFSDLRLTSRLLPARSQRTVDKCISDFRFPYRNRRTPRRDRRGFDPRALLSSQKRTLSDLQSGYIIVKEQSC